MTLQEAKDQVARKNGYEDFVSAELRTIFSESPIAIQIMEEAAELYANSKLIALREAIEKEIQLLKFSQAKSNAPHMWVRDLQLYDKCLSLIDSTLPENT